MVESEFHRYLNAKRVQGAGANEGQILTALEGMVDLLDKDVLEDDPPPRLPSDPVAVVTVPANGEALVAAATRDGRLVQLIERPVGGGRARRRWEIVRVESLEGFEVDSDRVLGLYWTRSANAFRRDPRLVTVVRRGREHRAYVRSTVPAESEVGAVDGSDLPDWMTVCPVVALPGVDLLQKRPGVPHRTALAAAWLPTGLVECFRTLPRDARRASAFEGEALGVRTDGIWVVSRDQSVRERTSRESEWVWTLDHQPLCVAPLDAAMSPPVLAGCEGGRLHLGVVVGRMKVADLWDRLRADLTAVRRLEGVDAWLRWGEEELERLAGPTKSGFHAWNPRVAVVLRLVMEASLDASPTPERAHALTRLFRRASNPSNFEATLRIVRPRIEAWCDGKTMSGAWALLEAYRRLPHDVQDLFDVELKRIPVMGDPALPHVGEAPRPRYDAGSDAAALEFLAKQSRVNRRELVADVGADPITRIALRAEAWRNAFVLETSLPPRGPLGAYAERRKGSLRVPVGAEWFAHLRRDEFLRIDPLGGVSLSEGLSSGWFRPSQFVLCAPPREGRAPRLIIADEDRIAIVDVDVDLRGQVAMREPVKIRGDHVVCGTVADAEHVFVVVEHGSAQGPVDKDATLGELWLWSIDEQKIVARAPWPAPIPREIAAVCAERGGRWHVFVDRPDDAVGHLAVERPTGADRLGVRSVRRRPLPGRVRTLCAVPEGQGRAACVLVGTTEGYVLDLDAEGPEPNLRVRWLYRCGAAIRHVVARTAGASPGIAVLSRLREALVLDYDGRCLWRRRLRVSPRSAAFLEKDGTVFLGIVDVEGTVHVFRRTDRARERALAIEAVQAIGEISRSSQGPDGDLSRHEVAWGLRELIQGRVPPLSDFGSLEARACVVRWCDDALGSNPATILEALRQVLDAATLPELAEIARVGVAKTHRGVVTEIARRIRNRIAAMTAGVDPREATNVLAELVRGLGAGVADASWSPVEPALEPAAAWVVGELMLRGGGAPLGLGAAVDRAVEIGSGAWAWLPLLVAPEDVAHAEALVRAIRLIEEGDESASEGPLLRDLPASKTLDALLRVLRLSVHPSPTWPELLLACSEPRPEGKTPFAQHLLDLLALYRRCVKSQSLPLDGQRGLLDELLVVDAPVPGPATEPCRAWLARLTERWVRACRPILAERRALLVHATRVRLEDLRVTPVATRVVAVRARVSADGRRVADATARIRAAEGSGLRPLSEPLDRRLSLAETPFELSWQAALEPGVSAVIVETRTEAGPDAFEETWTASVPPPRRAGRGLLDRLGDTRARVVEGLLSLPPGLHIFAADEALGAGAVAEGLVERGGYRVVDLDEEMAALGPGRARPTGFDAEAIVSALGIEHGTQGPVLAYPAAEAAHRLLGQGLRHVRTELIERLRRRPRLAIAVLLEPPDAIALHEALGRQGTLHLLHKMEGGEWPSDLVRGFAIDADAVSTAFAIFGGDLRLLQAWANEPMGERRRPTQFLSTPAAGRILQTDLEGLGPHDLAYLALSVRGTAKVPVTELVEGLVAAEAFTSMTRVTRPKEIVRVGEHLTRNDIASIVSDQSRTRHFTVRGRAVGGSSNLVPHELQPLAGVLPRTASQEELVFERLGERGVVKRLSGIAFVVAPYAAWIDAALSGDTSGRTFVEGEERAELFRVFTLAELAGAGEGLTALLPALPRETVRRAKQLGDLFRARRVDREAALRAMSSLSGSHHHAVHDASPKYVKLLADNILAAAGADESVVALPEKVGEPAILLVYLGPGSHLTADGLREISVPDKVVPVLFGPGATGLEGCEGAAVCVLGETTLKDMLLSTPIAAAFAHAVRNRVGLLKFSPFQVGRQLPEDSPVFVGREVETRRILEDLDKHSFLIVGARQIGKTSLLRHVYGRVRSAGLHAAIWVSAEDRYTPSDMLHQLHSAQPDVFPVPGDGDALDVIEAGIRSLKRPVLFINECDGFCTNAEGIKLLARLRALSESVPPACQCVFTGYQGALGTTVDAGHPFYHFAQGRIGEKAFFLGPIEPPAAEQLVDKLTRDPLGLQWRDRDVREYAVTQLSVRVHRIPMLLQLMCHQLVERLPPRRLVIERADVDAILDTPTLVWNHIRSTLPPKLSSSRDSTWVDLVLGVAARRHYFKEPDALVRSQRLRESSPVAFRALEIRDAVLNYAKSSLSSAEAERIDGTFPATAYPDLFQGLTLTVILSRVLGGDVEYCFAQHIYPIELREYLARSGKSLDEYLLQKLFDLLDLL